MRNKELANKLYNICSDMDILDYEDLKNTEINMLTNELEILQENNCNTLLNLLEIIVSM